MSLCTLTIQLFNSRLGESATQRERRLTYLREYARTLRNMRNMEKWLARFDDMCETATTSRAMKFMDKWLVRFENKRKPATSSHATETMEENSVR